MLRGELDWIVMKALEKDRARRYETANGLAMDIRRYLSRRGGPGRAAERVVSRAEVRAETSHLGGDGGGIHARAGDRRHGERLAGGAGHPRRGAGDGAARRRAEGSGEGGSGEQFLQTMLSSVNPLQMKGRDVTVRQVLDEAAKNVGKGSLQSQPTVAAAVRATLGETYQALGLYPQAEPHLREALDVRKAALGPDHRTWPRASPPWDRCSTTGAIWPAPSHFTGSPFASGAACLAPSTWTWPPS